jgi:hypothetical protein
VKAATGTDNSFSLVISYLQGNIPGRTTTYHGRCSNSKDAILEA